MFRKGLCLMLSLVLLAAAAPALADGQAETLAYLYSFAPGTLLEGEGMEPVRELLTEIQLCFTRRRTETDDLIRFQLLSSGEEAFGLIAGQEGEREFALNCSLMGGNQLTLRREQLPSFLLTLVQALGEQGILKGNNLMKMSALADKAGKVIGGYLDKAPEDAPDTGIDLAPYLRAITDSAEETLRREIPPEERDETGAAVETHYLVREEQRRFIANRAVDMISKLPVIGDELRGGRLRIGGQTVTDGLIRSAFADTPGDVTMELLQDEQGGLVRLLLHVPDLSGLITDPVFSQAQGITLSIRRDNGEGERASAVTVFGLEGLEGDLLTMSMERSAEGTIPPMRADQVYAVGEMNSTQLMELIRSMIWTIVANTGNMVLTLPRCVAQMLVRRILK